MEQLRRLFKSWFASRMRWVSLHAPYARPSLGNMSQCLRWTGSTICLKPILSRSGRCCWHQQTSCTGWRSQERARSRCPMLPLLMLNLKKQMTRLLLKLQMQNRSPQALLQHPTQMNSNKRPTWSSTSTNTCSAQSQIWFSMSAQSKSQL